MAFCGRCGTRIDPASIDEERDLATCKLCGNLIDMRQVAAAADSSGGAPSAARSPARDAVTLPPGISVSRDGGQLVITRRWMRTKHIVMHAIVLPLLLWVAYLWVSALGEDELPAVWVMVVTPIVMWVDFMTVAMLVNRTRVVVDGQTLKVTTAPLPIFPGCVVPRSEVVQLFSVLETQQGAKRIYTVMAELEGRRVQALVRFLISAEQALFIEQQLEAALGIEDVAVDGELPREAGAKPRLYPSVIGSRPLVEPLQLPAKSEAPKPVSALPALAFVIPFFGIPILIVVILSALGPSVEGQLRARGELGSWTFVPKSCTSGETLGFFGVELEGGKSETRRLRVMRDELDNPRFAILEAGKPARVIGPAECPSLESKVVRTNTRVNGVYVIEGRVAASCGLLSGTVSFEGCGP